MESHKAEERFTMVSHGKIPRDAFGPFGCIQASPVKFTEGRGVQELLYND